MSDAPIRLPRVSKNKRPQYFQDPAIVERLESWAVEADDRYQAHLRGEIESIDGDEVIARL